MRSFDDDSELKALLRASRPRPTRQFQAYLDTRVAERFTKTPRLRATSRIILKWFIASSSSIQSSLSRRTMSASRTAEWLTRMLPRSTTLWAAMIALGLSTGSVLASITSISSADRQLSIAVNGPPHVDRLVSRSDNWQVDDRYWASWSDHPQVDHRWASIWRSQGVGRSAWLAITPFTSSIHTAVADVASAAKSYGGTVDESIVRGSKSPRGAEAIVGLRVPDSALSDVAALLQKAVNDPRGFNDISRRAHVVSLAADKPQQSQTSHLVVWINSPVSVNSNRGFLDELSEIPRFIALIVALCLAYLARFVLGVFARRMARR